MGFKKVVASGARLHTPQPVVPPSPGARPVHAKAGLALRPRTPESVCMILTVTPNPAVDQTAWLDRVELGAVNRTRETHLDPAGKGINASRVAHRLGWPSVALGFLAGETGAIVEQALRAEGVLHHFVEVSGLTRVNVNLIDGAGAATSFYGPGPAVSSPDLSALDGIVRRWMRGGRVLVLAGSLPPGMSDDAYAGFIATAHEHGIAVILDAHGEPLRLGVAARPDVIKPNVREAERLLGRSLPDEAAVIAAARELSLCGIRTVVISMGAEGAVCASGARAWRVRSPPVEARSTVGSGDSMVAGIAIGLARGDAVVDGLRLGAAAGAATAMTRGTALGTADEVAELLPRVLVEAIG
jgi:1-phosphofructokinase family hexose kinase